MPIVLKTASSILPVTVELVKLHTVIGSEIGSVDDALLEMYIKQATRHGQNITGRSFVEATFELDLGSFPFGKINLMPNLQEVSSVTYMDMEGVEITLDPSLYKIRRTYLVGYIEPVESWPIDAEEILVTFSAGWPEDTGSATLPEDLIGWLMVTVAGMYEDREKFVFNNDGLDCYVVPGIGAGI